MNSSENKMTKRPSAADAQNVAAAVGRAVAMGLLPAQFEFPKLSYSVDEAAESSSFSSTTLWDAIAKGDLAAKKRGRRTYILAYELARWLEEGETASGLRGT